MENHHQNNYPGMPYEYSLESMGTSTLFQPASYAIAGPSTEVPYTARRRHSGGIRKASPESLLPLDAPTQPRRYVMPSVTSRKEIPAFFQKMRTNTPPSEDEEDELTEEPPASNATDQEKIEWKRRQNTLAARRSRKRKLMNLQRLEETVERLTREREIWKTRALTLKQLLISHGIICPEFRD
ncbi:putative basic region leucine zipper [Lyophyllum shimeji]|uniref:Basic region leucine zipper n=1 Tax=Lyophyllum shimeji TaxID=47721 RepID=A0A9P3PVF4_LYOSH|nr:putative basic region leucine zipper [Lyophyllum shimeji]